MDLSGTPSSARGNRRGLDRRPSDEVKKVLSTLSGQGIQDLLNTSGATYWSQGSEDAKVRFLELFRLKLMEEIPPKELGTDQLRRRYAFGVRLTALGQESRKFLYALISEFVQELGRSGG
jgi:hypothetical protein